MTAQVRKYMLRRVNKLTFHRSDYYVAYELRGARWPRRTKSRRMDPRNSRSRRCRACRSTTCESSRREGHRRCKHRIQTRRLQAIWRRRLHNKLHQARLAEGSHRHHEGKGRRCYLRPRRHDSRLFEVHCMEGTCGCRRLRWRSN